MGTKDAVFLRSNSASKEIFQGNLLDLEQGMGRCHSSSFITDTASVRFASPRFGGQGRKLRGAPEELIVDLKRRPLCGTSRHEVCPLSTLRKGVKFWLPVFSGKTY